MSKTKSPKPAEQPMDPHRLARYYFEKFGQDNQKRITLRYWQSEWWVWKDGRYIRVGKDELKAQLAREIKLRVDAVPLVDSYNRAYPVTGSVISNVTTALSSMALLPDIVDQPSWVGREPTTAQYLSMQNGLLNVELATTNPQSALRPHSPDWFSPVYVPYDFDPQASCPRWLAFLDRVLEGDVERINILQEWFGLCLTADTSFQKFLILEGAGSNGKSITLDVLRLVVGETNVSNVPLEDYDKRFQLTPTLGKLVNIASESDNEHLPEGVIKQFVGGDVLQFDRKGISHIQARPTARLVFATNNKPTIGDRSDGLWRRVLFIPFNVTIGAAERDLHLLAKLKNEVSGILNWALQGRRRLLEQKSFTISAVSEAHINKYRSTSNPVREFFEDCCEYSLGPVVVKKDLYRAYAVWASIRGLKPLDDSKFATEVERAFPGVTDARPTIDGKRQRVWNNLILVVAREVTEPTAA